MTLGILSDSHGALKNAQALIQKMGDIDALCFLGDVAQDISTMEEALSKKRTPVALYAVKGNNDITSSLPEEQVLTLAGKRILLTHGHVQGVKQGRMRLNLRAREVQADVALFGHTHCAYVSYDYGVLTINPGAVCGGYGGGVPRAAVLTLDERDGQMHVVQITL